MFLSFQIRDHTAGNVDFASASLAFCRLRNRAFKFRYAFPPKKGVSRRRPLGKQSASLFSPPPTAQILVSVTALPIPSSFSSQKTHGPLESLVCWQCREDGISLPRWKVDPSLFWEHPPFVRATSLFCCSARSVWDPLYEGA